MADIVSPTLSDLKGLEAKKVALRSVEYAATHGVPTFSSIAESLVQPRYDLVYQEVTLFIEGVQVPFEFVSISSSYGATPEATISIPYFPGILDICKGYFPKVHIFFKDLGFQKFLNMTDVDYEEKDLRRLLFSGVLVGSSYTKNKSTDSDSVQVSFRCVHKYYAMQEVVIKMIGGGTDQVTDSARNESMASGALFNSRAYITLAMAGVQVPWTDSDTPVESEVNIPLSGSQANRNTNHIQKDLRPYQYRFQGMPGILLNIWNAMRRDSYVQSDYSKMMTELYIPLVENGLKFFKRMTGHPLVESAVDKDKSTISGEVKAKLEGLKNVDDSVMIIAPPAYANLIQKAATIESGIMSMESFFSQQNEASDYIGLVAGVLKYLKYDLEVLASPVQVLDRTMESIDVVIKPSLPQYFSPTCNVLLPHMHSSIRHEDFSYSVPTRMFAPMTPYAGLNNETEKLAYLTPEDARIVTAARHPQAAFNLAATTLYIGGFQTAIEEGRGVKIRMTGLDPWMQHILQSEQATQAQSTPSGNNKYPVPTDKLIAEGRAVINVSTSKLEDMSDESRVWKYWDKSKPIPLYIASIETSGWNMEWGVAGKLSPQDVTVASKITPFRAATKVPKYWNVLYFPDKNSFLTFPPHYDYVRDQFYQTKELAAAKGTGEDPYTSVTKGTPPSPYAPADETLVTKTLVNGAPVLDVALETTADKEAAKETTSSSSSSTEQYSTYAGYKTFEEINEILKKEWESNHPGIPSLNPYESTAVNGIQPFQLTLFNFMDYEFSLAVTDSRTGSAECPFNPFIVPGYPMDIVEASPEKPSIHAFCTSVTHSITGSSISTSVSFIGGATYDELRAYRTLPVPPWFVYHLGLTSANSILDQSPEALRLAGEFYKGVLGVGAANPDELEDYITGGAATVVINAEGNMVKMGSNIFNKKGFGDISAPFQGASFKEIMDPNATYSGNLALVRREIESQVDVERLNEVRFVEIQSRPNALTSEDEVKISPAHPRSIGVPMGRSLFLDYSIEDQKIFEYIKKKAPAAKLDEQLSDIAIDVVSSLANGVIPGSKSDYVSK